MSALFEVLSKIQKEMKAPRASTIPLGSISIARAKISLRAVSRFSTEQCCISAMRWC